jgi:hypothetical protein
MTCNEGVRLAVARLPSDHPAISRVVFFYGPSPVTLDSGPIHPDASVVFTFANGSSEVVQLYGPPVPGATPRALPPAPWPTGVSIPPP